MKRHIPGLAAGVRNADDFLEGLFLVRVDHVNYRWHPQKPCFLIRFVILEPEELRSRGVSGRLYCTPKALWRLNWFLRDFGYDTDLLGRDEVDEKGLLGLTGRNPYFPQGTRRPQLPKSRWVCSYGRMGKPVDRRQYRNSQREEGLP